SANLWQRFPLPKTREKIGHVASMLGLLDKLPLLSANLSHGDQKLLDIALALVLEPRVLLLDEPTAGVNPTLQNEIGERLLELPKRGITVLLIEHDMSFIANLCDPVIVMAEGQVLMQGTFD
ncbi:AAA family ATPase, partial [Glaesserella parasuis]|uniref:AAA family ATPase n=1 Tax=Glaesserella parasuis TaxID=738 RepID=UPI003B82AECF